ncbi:MAG: phage tail protein [Xenococcaceae cyanobacterium MO_207.B15]|nr:phage tail protein [Xenococcaceae cyanobacterium MO_207.B15]MDJ0745964.1 phage tail protein [Xenococcaceae cyanobacterium MO_167.B27]
MANGQQDELLVNCRFYFEADDITDKLILEVSGLSSETPAAGGDKVLGSGKQAVNLRQAAPTQVKFSPVTVKIVATNNKDLYQWYEDCNRNDGGQSKWSEQRKTASIVVYDQNATEQARWNLDFCYPTKYEGPKLEAGSNDVANETITLVHQGIKRVN